jgi:hypothetical protein
VCVCVWLDVMGFQSMNVLGFAGFCWYGKGVLYSLSRPSEEACA